MSFLDELQESTKTKAQLEEEERLRQQHIFEHDVRSFVDTIKDYCRYAAERGKRSTAVTKQWDDHPVSFRKAEAHRFAEGVETLLREDGLTDISCQIRRIGNILQDRYSVTFTVRW